MSQFQMPAEWSSQPPGTSGLAVASLICSLVCCLPFLPALGLLLGVVAMVSIGGNPARRGRGLAVTGIVLGLVFSLGQVGAGILTSKYIVPSWKLVMRGPADVLRAGSDGDLAGFKAGFYGAGATATDEQARAFLDELSSRYGAFKSVRFDEKNQPQGQAFGKPEATFRYVIEFEKTSAGADVRIIFADESRGGFVNKFGSITVRDQEHGDLSYPPAPAPAPAGGGGGGP